MIRRSFILGSLALFAGCGGAGVTTTDLRGKLAAEVARVVVTMEQVAPSLPPSPTFAQMNSAIAAIEARLTPRLAGEFTVEELKALRRFYASPDGQSVVALAFAEEGGRDKPVLQPESYSRIDAAFADPVIARSVGVLRRVLRDAFASEPVFTKG